jgi:hypothetical protein
VNPVRIRRTSNVRVRLSTYDVIATHVTIDEVRTVPVLGRT